MAAEQRVDFEKYRVLFEQSVARMRQEPGRVAASGPSASVRVLKDRLFEARVRDFTFLMDEPPERGGGDQAAAPMEYFVAGAAG